MEAEIGHMQYKATKHQGVLVATTWLGRGREEFFPGVSRGDIILPTPEVTDLSVTQAPESHLTNLYVDSGEHSNHKPRIWGFIIYGL